jgi:hypothetical protein
LVKALRDLNFFGRVKTTFDAFFFHGCEESIDAVSASVGCMSVEEPKVDEALGDSLL